MNLNNLEHSIPSLQEINAELARRSFKEFVLYTMPSYMLNWHHKLLMDKLQDFAEGRIKKLMVFMPPQHGKSELTSRRLPAYILGRTPYKKMVGCSYASELSKSFNRDVQRIIDDPVYYRAFPNTTLNKSNVKTSARGSYLRNADIFEVVGSTGFYKSVGVGGSLTGTPVDIGIIDDPVKDAVEAGSPTYRARVWDWYTQVFLTRLHNDSQILVTQTRWHEDDLSGRILKQDDAHEWEVLSLPAILDSDHEKHYLDPRSIGEALWEERHGLKKLISFKKQNPRAFQALYQQDPRPFEGGLVYSNWNTISDLEYNKIKSTLIYGLDFGYSTSPAALVEVKIHGKNIYLKELIYRTKLGIDVLSNLIKNSIKGRQSKIIADSADPILIDHLKKKYGLNVRKAHKGKDSVPFGISLMNTYNIYVHESSKNLIFELSNYRYKEDADGNPLEEPIKDHDHALDAARYAVSHKVEKGGNNILAFG